MLNKSLFTSNKADWNTPERIKNILFRVWHCGPILDPCWNNTSIIPAAVTYDINKGQDGLKEPWLHKTFCNPPYSKEIIKWVNKAINEWDSYEENDSILLLPARPDTRWMHICFEKASAICFLIGRLKFLGAKSSAPFPSCLIYFGNEVDNFKEACQDEGHTIVLR